MDPKWVAPLMTDGHFHAISTMDSKGNDLDSMVDVPTPKFTIQLRMKYSSHVSFR
jgi:hypothetical protein